MCGTNAAGCPAMLLGTLDNQRSSDCHGSLGSASISNGHACFTESIAFYFCNSGYFLSGNKTRLCQTDGNWTGDGSTCIEANSGFNIGRPE